MKFLNLVGNSFGCSATGERLISAARDGDVQEARDLLEYNPHLAKYSTFGARNSPLHYSAAQGHHEIVSLLLESGVDVDLKNYRGQTALMQACQHGHWEVVQTLILFKANIHKSDYLNGGTALHLAALNGHARCIRLLLADYIPSIPSIWHTLRKRSNDEDTISEFHECALYRIINQTSDGGITALHMAALNGHVETVHLLLDLGASVTEITIGDGTTIDLIGSGSTPLHYAACGGNTQCCQLLIASGASLKARNANGFTPLMIARAWRRDGLDEILSTRPKEQPQITPSPYLCLPLMSIVKIARECGWGSKDLCQACEDPCVVCLERKCTVATEGCNHEFCTWCALYLCSTNSARTRGNAPPGSIACPLCRHGIVSFVKLPDTQPLMTDTFKTSLSLSLFPCINEGGPETTTSMKTPFCKPDTATTTAQSSPVKSGFRLLGSRRFSSSFKFSPRLCMGDSDVCSSLVDKAKASGEEITSGSKPSYRRAASHKERKKSWFCSLNQCVAPGRR